MSRYRVVLGLPIKQVKNKLPLLRTQVKRHRSEGIPSQETQSSRFIPFRTPNQMKHLKILPLWECLCFISSSKTLMARGEFCQLFLALLYSWELPHMGTSFGFFRKWQIPQHVRAAQHCTYIQVWPDTSPSCLPAAYRQTHKCKTFST